MKAVVFMICFCLMTGFMGATLYADESPTGTLYPPRLAVGKVGVFSIGDIPATKVTGTFLGRPVYFHRWQGRLFSLLPVDLSSSPGSYPLSIEYQYVHHGTKKLITIDIEVHPYEFSVEEVSLPEKMVTFPKEILERILNEKKTVYAAFEKTGEMPLWNGDFIKPVDGDIVGLFGSRRILNGKDRNPHLGIDIRAERGTPLLCANNGRVALVGDFYLMGKTVIIDHGQGAFTVYCHLSRVMVKEGEVVAKGESLGEVGDTGRATGSHVHWGACIYGARVDPLSLIEATTALAETGK